METHMKLNMIDKAAIKAAFKGFPRAKVIVDLQNNEAYIEAKGVKVGVIEKRPDEWGIRLTAPLKVRFGSFVKGKQTLYYCTLQSIYEKVTVPLTKNTQQFINFLDVKIIVHSGQLFTFNQEKNAVLFGVIPKLDFDIPRHLWNKAVAFERNIDYHYRSLIDK